MNIIQIIDKQIIVNKNMKKKVTIILVLAVEVEGEEGEEIVN
jgi:hypothetical protein